MAVILKNATFIHWQTLEFKQANIRVSEKDGIEFLSAIPQDGKEEILDCTGKLVTKSFACGHHHALVFLFRFQA